MRERYFPASYLFNKLNEWNDGHLIINSVAGEYISIIMNSRPDRQQLLKFAQDYDFNDQVKPNKWQCRFFNSSREVLLASTYKFYDNNNTVKLILPLQKKSYSNNSVIKVRTNKPNNFIRDLKALLDPLPAPKPAPTNTRFTFFYWHVVYGSITRYCQNLLNRDFGIREFFTTIFNR